MWDRPGMTDLPVYYEFIETPVFLRRLEELASDETLEAIHLSLLAACGANLFVVSVWKERAIQPFASASKTIRERDSENKRRSYR
jgi:hypothetical protein